MLILINSIPHNQRGLPCGWDTSRAEVGEAVAIGLGEAVVVGVGRAVDVDVGRAVAVGVGSSHPLNPIGAYMRFAATASDMP